MTAFHPRDFRRGLRHAGLTHGEYRVAVELAEHSNRDDPIVWPSVAALADVCAMTERGVQGILSSLSAKGVATRVSSTKGGRGNTNRWRLLIKTPNDASGFTAGSEAETPNETAQKPRTKLHKTPNRRSPEVVRSSSLEGGEGARARADEPTDEPLDVDAVADPDDEPPTPEDLPANKQPSEPEAVEPATGEVVAQRIDDMDGGTIVDGEIVETDSDPEPPLECAKHRNWPIDIERPNCHACRRVREANQSAHDAWTFRALCISGSPAEPAKPAPAPRHDPKPRPVPPSWVPGPDGRPRCRRHGHLPTAPVDCTRCHDAAIAAGKSA